MCGAGGAGQSDAGDAGEVGCGDPRSVRRVVQIHGLEQAQKELGPLVVEAKLPQVGQPRAESYEGEGYAILRHPDTEVVEKALARLVALVRIELG